jgi:hypothetical protein
MMSQVFLLYNFAIMLKSLAVIVFFALAIGAMCANPHATPSKDAQRADDPSHAPVSVNSYTYTAGDQKKSYEGHWWGYRFIQWPEGATATLLLVSLVILSIQTNSTRKAANASKSAAEAALRQIQMMKDKERARVEIKAVGLELEYVGDVEEFWHLKAEITLRNVGAGRAYIRDGIGDMAVGGPEELRNMLGTLNIVNGFIDPDIEPITESFYFFHTEHINLPEFAKNISAGSLPIFIAGYIEYETVGTRYRHNFSYSWMGNENPRNIAAALSGSYEIKSEDDRERVSRGFWRKDPSEANGEYEIAQTEPIPPLWWKAREWFRRGMEETRPD